MFLNGERVNHFRHNLTAPLQDVTVDGIMSEICFSTMTATLIVSMATDVATPDTDY